MTLNNLKEKHSAFYKAFVKMHRDIELQKSGNLGHGIDHDLLVAGYSILLAPNTEVAELAWCSALLHSIDRFYKENTPIKTDELLTLLQGLTLKHISTIRNAALGHHLPNDNSDSETAVILKDSDKLANLGPTLLVRCGQHRHNIPYVDIENIYLVGNTRTPGTIHGKPGSCMDDLLSCYEWVSTENPKFVLRTKKAIELSKIYKNFLQKYFKLTKFQFRQAGLENYKI